VTRGRKRYVCVCTKRVCVSNTEPKACIVDMTIHKNQSMRLHLFIVNGILKNKFNIHNIHYKAKFACKEYNLIQVYNKLLVIQA